MMRYIGTPVRIHPDGEPGNPREKRDVLRFPDEKQEGAYVVSRTLPDDVARMKNLVELVIFTPRGSFTADPDFGFEYWNHEYANVFFRDFNNGQGSVVAEVTKQACEDSIRDSILAYEPAVKQIDVSMELRTLSPAELHKRKTLSRYEVLVHVSWWQDDGLGVLRDYDTEVRFLMEPTAIKQKI